MKRTTILFALTVLSIASWAQGFGVKAGLNLASWGGDEVSGLDARVGYQIGISGRKAISEKVYWVPGLTFSQKGVTMSETYDYEISPGQEIQSRFEAMGKTNYLEVPIGFHYYVEPSLFLIARPTVGFLVYKNFRTTGVECLGNQCTGWSEEGDLDLRGVDLSFGLGMGYSFTERISLQASYDWGLLNLAEDLSEAYNRVLNFSLEYRF